VYNQLCHQPGVTASCQQLHHPHHLALHSTKYKYIYIYLIIIHKCTTAPCFIKFSKLKQKFCFMFICMLYLAESLIILYMQNLLIFLQFINFYKKNHDKISLLNMQIFNKWSIEFLNLTFSYDNFTILLCINIIFIYIIKIGTIWG